LTFVTKDDIIKHNAIRVYFCVYNQRRMGGNIIKKRTKVILFLLLAVLVILALTAFHFRSYINAFIISQTKTPEELRQMMENGKTPEQLLENYDGINVRDLTPEEKEKLANNEITEQEAIELIVGKSEEELLHIPDEYKQGSGPAVDIDIPPPPDASDVPPPPDISAPPSEDDPDISDILASPPTVTNPPQDNPVVPPENSGPDNTDIGTTGSDYVPIDITEPPKQSETTDKPMISDEKLKETNEKIARLVAQLYVTKSQSNTRLSNMEAEWKAEYLKVPNKERTATNLLATYVKRAVKIVAQWEADTDAQVEEILKQVKTLLKESGQDQGLVDSLKAAYEEEKTNIKAYYMGKINKWI